MGSDYHAPSSRSQERRTRLYDDGLKRGRSHKHAHEHCNEHGNEGDRRREESYDTRADSRIEDKLKRIEYRRRQEAADAEIEWGAPKRQSESLSAPKQSRVEEMEERQRAESSEFIRYADDQTLNVQQKKIVRWDDPARYFVEELRPQVQKHRLQPNRFGILPGKAWDGVDRSNGFEVRLFQMRASKTVKRDLSHQYDVEDY